MDYIAQPKDYWIAQQALNITLNAVDSPNRIQGAVASGAAILCYIEGVDGLGYDNGHHFQTWPLSLSPTYFNSDTKKYVYAAIPRNSDVGTQAIIVFPSDQLDIYGMNANDEQIGSTDYYYIWLQGIITATNGATDRDWEQRIDFGKKGTDEDLYDWTETEWYIYSKVSEIVTFLKPIFMKAGSYFKNLILGRRELTGVAITNDEWTDSDELVATPGYVEKNYLSKTHDDSAAGNISFEQNIEVKEDADILGQLGVKGDATVDGILSALAKILTNRIESNNWTGDGPFDTGFQLLKGQDGVTSMVVDNLFVRMKAIFTELEIRKISYAGGNIIFSHAGSKVVRVEPVYRGISAEVEGHKAILDGAVDVSGNTAYLGGGTVTGHKLTITNSQSLYAYRCYLLADDGSTRTENWWRVDDLARCQTFNIKEGVYQDVSNQFYWRRVIATGSETLEDGKVYDYVDLSAADCMQGSTVPQAGDQLVQMGNRTDTTRQGFVTIEVSGDYAPAFKVYKGVNEYNLDGKRKICLSPALTDLRVQKLVIETEYDVQRVPMERGDWSSIADHKCYYYDLVQHNGATWLCIYPESGIGGVLYTTEAPSDTATYWKIYAQKGQKGDTGTKGDKGDKGDSVAYDPTHSSMGYAYSSMGTPEQGRDYPSDITSWSSNPPTPQKGKYLWTKDVTAYNNAGTIVYTTTYGVTYEPNDGESVQIDSTRTFVKYCKQSASQYTGQIPSDNDFSTQYPSSFAQGDYLWILNQVAYVGVTTALKSYSLSRLGVDGDQGDPGPDGYTTHFAYATSADGSQNFSTTNFNGATYIGTYRDQNAADSTDYRDYTWTQWKGNQGANGKDGWMVTADPANVIITQALADDTTSFSTATVSFTAKKGSVAVAIDSIGTPSSTEFVVAKKGSTGDDAKKVLVRQPNTHGNPAEYYTEGSFLVNVNVTDPDTNQTVTFPVTVLCYANLLGTWKETVEADVKHEVATAKFYFEDENGIVVAHETIGDYIKSSTEKTSQLERITKMYALLSDGSECYFTDEDFVDVTDSVVHLEAGKYIVHAEINVDTLPSGNYVFSVGNLLSYEGSDPIINQEITVATAGDYTITIEDDVQSGSGHVVELYIQEKQTSISIMKQTADDIKLFVTDGLEDTGIFIEQGLIKAQTSKFEIWDQTGTTRTFSIDPDGNLQGSGNASIIGTIKNGAYTENGVTKYANELGQYGSGHLAKGNISWDNAGELSVKGSINATGGSITGVMAIGDKRYSHIELDPNNDNFGAAIIGKSGSKTYFSLSFNGLSDTNPQLRLGRQVGETFWDFEYAKLSPSELIISSFADKTNPDDTRRFNMTTKCYKKNTFVPNYEFFGTYYCANDIYGLKIGTLSSGVAFINSDYWPDVETDNSLIRDLPIGTVFMIGRKVINGCGARQLWVKISNPSS